MVNLLFVVRESDFGAGSKGLLKNPLLRAGIGFPARGWFGNSNSRTNLGVEVGNKRICQAGYAMLDLQNYLLQVYQTPGWLRKCPIIVFTVSSHLQASFTERVPTTSKPGSDVCRTPTSGVPAGISVVS
jgi:hypothetical protein